VVGNYVIVGAGEAGVAAAAAIRKGAPQARIKLVTDEVGLPYERPPLSKEVLLREPVQTLLRKPEWYDDNRIELIRARALAIEPGTRTVQVAAPGAADGRIGYDQVLIATGATARRLPFPGILYLRTWDDALAIRRRLENAGKVIVIGGGVIGLELASAARALGHQVVILELAERLMARAVAPDVALWLHRLHASVDVDLRFGASVRAIAKRGAEFDVQLGDGTVLNADLILAGVGAAPETELARTAGCAIEDGVLVDASGRTSIEGIYAAGDGARFYHPGIGSHIRLEAWQHAGRHGSHVGEVMTGGTQQYQCMPWFWTDQHGINLQVAGFAAETEYTVWRGSGSSRSAFHFIGDRLVAASTVDNGRNIRPAVQLIEAGWVGNPATLADATVPLRHIVQSWNASQNAVQSTL
jgi:3-phenylpropionate/trans-cinnamate dioxygenase ferredoxin reductase component